MFLELPSGLNRAKSAFVIAGHGQGDPSWAASRVLQAAHLRCVLEDSKPSQRLGSIRIEKERDAVLMVLLDANFDAFEMYEAERPAVVEALTAPGSRARNERGALTVSEFKSIGRLRRRRPAV
jgi:hypothetical protein